MVDDFIERRHGRRAITYELPELEPILRPTYGVIVFQEQVMQIATTLGGFTLGGADLLRRAMGKKKPEVMAEQREHFVRGAVHNGYPEEPAAKIFDLIAYFAGYGFNRSHSVAYALIAYRTAYLKAHFPREFMAALITSDMDNTDKVMRYIGDCRDMGIAVLPPDINAGSYGFTVAGDSIRFGLGAIKGVGEQLAYEKEALGFYISSHPLMAVQQQMRRLVTATSQSLAECQGEPTVTLGGLITQHRAQLTKNGDRMAFLTLEDLYGSLEVIVFPDTYRQSVTACESDEPVVVWGKAKVEGEGGETRILAQRILLLKDALALGEFRRLMLVVAPQHDRTTLLHVHDLLAQAPGTCQVVLALQFPDGERVLLRTA